MNLVESLGEEVECTDSEGFFEGCKNQEAALRSVARRVGKDLRYLREQQYIFILTIFNAMESVAVWGKGGHRDGELVVAARQRQREPEI